MGGEGTWTSVCLNDTVHCHCAGCVWEDSEGHPSQTGSASSSVSGEGAAAGLHHSDVPRRSVVYRLQYINRHLIIANINTSNTV